MQTLEEKYQELLQKYVDLSERYYQQACNFRELADAHEALLKSTRTASPERVDEFFLRD